MECECSHFQPLYTYHGFKLWPEVTLCWICYGLKSHYIGCAVALGRIVLYVLNVKKIYQSRSFILVLFAMLYKYQSVHVSSRLFASCNLNMGYAFLILFDFIHIIILNTLPFMLASDFLFVVNVKIHVASFVHIAYACKEEAT